MNKKYDWPDIEYGSAEYYRRWRLVNGERYRKWKRKYDRELYRRFPDREQARRRRWAANNPEKMLAYRLKAEAMRTGKLEPEPCKVCKSDKAIAHHDDYSRPLDVIWLCELHHKARHRALKELQKV